MVNYLRMKRNEWRIRAMLYGAILSVMEEISHSKHQENK